VIEVCWIRTKGTQSRSLGRKTWLTAIVAVLVWTWAIQGWGEEDGLRGQKFSPHTTGPVYTDTTIPLSPGKAVIFVPINPAFTGGRFSPNWRRVSAGGDYSSLSTALQLHYGLVPRLEVYSVILYQHNWALNVDHPAPTGQKDAGFGGLGDISVNSKYLLLEQKTYFPAVAGIFFVSFPSGHYRHPNPRFLGTDHIGQGSYNFTPGLNFYKYIPPALLHGNLWYTLSTDTTIGGRRTYYLDKVTLNLAMEYPIVRRRWIFLFEFVSSYDGGRLIGHKANTPPQTLMSIFPGLEFLPGGNLSFDAGVLIDLFGKHERYNYTPNFSILYTF
jgi:hypothetical protein